MHCKKVILNTTASGGTTNSVLMFLFFRQLNLKYAFIMRFLFVGQKNPFCGKNMFLLVKFNVVLKERPGFIHP